MCVEMCVCVLEALRPDYINSHNVWTMQSSSAEFGHMEMRRHLGASSSFITPPAGRLRCWSSTSSPVAECHRGLWRATKRWFDQLWLISWLSFQLTDRSADTFIPSSLLGADFFLFVLKLMEQKQRGFDGKPTTGTHTPVVNQQETIKSLFTL